MKKSFLISMGIVFLFFSDLAAKDLLTWQVVHWPPFQMLEGLDKGQGRFDALLELYKTNLPQYEHKTIAINWARFFNEIKKGEKICSIFIIRTKERDTFAWFSKPASIGLPLRIMMRESSIETLGNRNPISIVTLVKDNRFRGILVYKRSYYTVIDKILEDYASLSTVKRLATPEESIIQMLLAGRADYTIEYPYVANYMANKFQAEYDTKIESIPIKELQEYGQSSCACPKNDWGKKVIEDFDKMLERIKRTPEFLKIMQMYHTDPKELEEIRQQVTKIIINTK